ncbi:conserved hypothetical protein [Pediculus humanus corporis]|uniref:EB domain-containing protein n=1 Tax=Pediculus humanus subsp. corporis TaxID=121224 RepID=E0VUP4_PEDHC|nr:uncharacterized protein Phum_PHUM452810 [Pediculus humanus corporis]EEB17100.1 conserved hypothetical protein [Pediculus humanus corporis]
MAPIQTTNYYLFNESSDCLYDEDCITRNSYCKGNKICACKIGYQYDLGSDICFPKDYDCSALNNAKCISGFCKCKNDYVSSNDKTMCLPSMKLTTYCQEDGQCNSVMNKTYCDPIIRQCVCERGFKRDSYKLQCIQNTRLHSPCFSVDDCEYDTETKGKYDCKFVSRLLSTCECREGFYEINDDCHDSSGDR